jgi:hypothetical protein
VGGEREKRGDQVEKGEERERERSGSGRLIRGDELRTWGFFLFGLS